MSRRFPAWYMGRHADHHIISASYNSDMAADFGRDVRNIVSSREYAALFPQTALAADSQSAERFHISGGGGYVAAGVGTAMTGRSAHIMNIDDPLKDRASAESETQRSAVWDWYRAVAYTRLRPDAVIVVTQTRWHEEDLAGKLLLAEAEGGERWTKLILPAIDADGRALWEDAYPRPVLDQIRATIGEYDWASLYEQRPRPRGGSFFTEASLLVNGAPVAYPFNPELVFATIDSAVKTGKQHDGVGVVYWAYLKAAQALVILDWDLKQVEGALLETWLPTVYQRLEALAKDCRARFGSRGAFIEDKASGMILLQQARNRGWAAIPIDSKLTSLGKSERAINCSGYVHGGQVKISEPAFRRVVTYKGVTKNHLLGQVLAFRAGTADMGDDDLLDCFSYGVSLSLGNRAGF